MLLLLLPSPHVWHRCRCCSGCCCCCCCCCCTTRHKRPFPFPRFVISLTLYFVPIPPSQRDGCPKIINLGSAKTDLFYERKKYGFKKRV